MANECGPTPRHLTISLARDIGHKTGNCQASGGMRVSAVVPTSRTACHTGADAYGTERTTTVFLTHPRSNPLHLTSMNAYPGQP
jgi:hypothetical protein